MSHEEDAILSEWLDRLKGLNVHVKKKFGCYCLYCDNQVVGWIHDSFLSLREVGLDYLPKGITRPKPQDKIQELVISFDYIMPNGCQKRFRTQLYIEKSKKRRYSFVKIISFLFSSIICITVNP